MLVRSIQEIERESRIFRAEVRDKVELCEGVSRVLLMDTLGDYIYCLLEGSGWCEKVRLLNQGDKVLVGPCKIETVPEKYRAFYSPIIPGKYTSPFYLHYSSDARDLKFEIERILANTKLSYNFRPLRECQQLANINSISKVSIAGIIIDYVSEIKMPKDNICKLKIVDDSLAPLDFIQLHIFTETTLKQISIGDIIIAHGVTFKQFRGKAQGVHNKHSGALAIYSAVENEEPKLVSKIQNFNENEDVTQNVLRLFDWEISTLSHRDLMTGPTLSSIGESNHFRFKTIDMVCHVALNKQDYPEPHQSTLVLCDSSGYLFLTNFTCLMSHIKEGMWIKIREAKVFSDQVQMGEHSSIVVIPNWSYNVRIHLENTVPGLENIKLQALDYFFKTYDQNALNQQILITRTSMSSAPLFDESQLLNPLDNASFCRLKVIIIEVQPKNIEDGVIEKNGRWEFTGLLNIWCLNEILDVIVSGDSSIDLFGLKDVTDKSIFIQKINDVVKLLVKGNNWVELGLKRKIAGNKVILKVVNTILT